MRTLIVYANYKENSFTSAIKDQVAETFHQNGHEVVIRNLYEIKFNPVLTKNDLESIENEIFPVDIMNEQKFIQWADLICFVYPIWWSGMPAILKGYLERVLVMGYAFEFKGDDVIPKLTNKKVAIFNSTGNKKVYKNEKHLEALNIITREAIFGFCGMKVIEHKYYQCCDKNNSVEVEKIMDDIKTTVETILKNNNF
ncbi:MAG: NAD(P)H-dependent oxidoreductase [Bacteroidales bacterium]|jgi:NAD(P)H dehydrogenase (quinone)|nr:NAD(P)H-dependent oxidoreductase [Bacteroidales bacterium]HOL98369.1 NAD(P)H-dependent oxidoreductase [Bacteroidales bacterium]HOM36786.1 NAD(P)H-dependent oxidoreductase [Bacteroidales bacterium]HPD24632.1 NAD(P)H-dependent oxidoreductase [Bacteroidales bacterium]HRS99538.1 NAD(P)H-dependent oxidoreductase [Bacteroidales bacterium]